jgi:ATP-binding cassette subfamily B protein
MAQGGGMSVTHPGVPAPGAPAQEAARHEGPLTRITWALRFAWDSGRGLTLANASLTALQALTPLLALYVMKLIVDTVVAGVASGDAEAVWNRIAMLVAAAACVMLAERALATIADLVRALHAQRATDRVYRILHAKSIEVDLQYYEQPGTARSRKPRTGRRASSRASSRLGRVRSRWSRSARCFSRSTGASRCSSCSPDCRAC